MLLDAVLTSPDAVIRGLCYVPHAGGSVRAGFPICAVTAMGPDKQQCYANLLAEADELLNMA